MRQIKNSNHIITRDVSLTAFKRKDSYKCHFKNICSFTQQKCIEYPLYHRLYASSCSWKDPAPVYENFGEGRHEKITKQNNRCYNVDV